MVVGIISPMDIVVSLVLSLLHLFFSGHEEMVIGVSPVELATSTEATVVYVIDGDTVVVNLDGIEQKVRYIGIDTPETFKGKESDCYGAEATKKNRELVEGKVVKLVSDSENVDKCGRLCATYIAVKCL